MRTPNIKNLAQLKKLGIPGLIIFGVISIINLQNPSNKKSAHQPDLNLIYTHHAKCRMGCRQIDRDEVQDVIQNGRVNPRKSKPNDQPCPTKAIEHRSKDRQLIRVILADCKNAQKIITVIDLEKKYSCNCR